MSWFDILAILFVLSVLFSYLNHRFIWLPTTIELMLIALPLSLLLILFRKNWVAWLRNFPRAC